jgi:hypothetical protein
MSRIRTRSVSAPLSRAALLLGLLFVSVLSLAAQQIPSGTDLEVRNSSEISSGKVTAGSEWTGTLVHSIKVDGKTVAPAGSTVTGRVSDVQPSGRLSKPGELALEVTSVNGIEVTTDAYAKDGAGHTKSNVAKIGGGTAAGALLGGIFGGGKGAAIGALAGGGAGTAGAAATGKREAVIKPETTMHFRVQ